MDLEQIRFFNKSYDMNKLLKIPTTNTTLDLTLVTNSLLNTVGPLNKIAAPYILGTVNTEGVAIICVLYGLHNYCNS